MTRPTLQAGDVVLRPTDTGDLDWLRDFFATPGVYEQWGGVPLSDSEIEAKYLGTRSPRVECFIVDEAGQSIGFVQYHDADDGDAGGGMDLALVPDARGRGVGTAVAHVIAEFVTVHLGWRRFTVDPDVANDRGVNFWRNAGFRPVGIVDDDPDRAPYWRMEWEPTTE